MTRLTRRRMLAAVGTGTVAAVAGCTGDGEDGTPEEDDGGSSADEQEGADATEPESAADTAGEEPADSTTAGALGLDHGSERAVYEYLQGVDEGSVDAANGAIRPESNLRLEGGDITDPGVTIHELERVDLREVVRERNDVEGEELDQRVAEREQEIGELLTEAGGDDYAYVYNSITSEQYGGEETYILVVAVDGEWLLWGQ